MPLAVGLASNVLLNLVLLPRLGLQGAVIATALATLVALAAQIVVNWRLGMPPSVGTLLVSLAPLALAMGFPTAVSTGGLIGLLVFFTPWVLSTEERREIIGIARERLQRFAPARTTGLAREG